MPFTREQLKEFSGDIASLDEAQVWYMNENKDSDVCLAVRGRIVGVGYTHSVDALIARLNLVDASEFEILNGFLLELGAPLRAGKKPDGPRT